MVQTDCGLCEDDHQAKHDCSMQIGIEMGWLHHIGKIRPGGGYWAGHQHQHQQLRRHWGQVAVRWKQVRKSFLPKKSLVSTLDDRGLTVLEILTPPVNTMLYNADCRYFASGLADFVPFSFSSAPLMCEKSGDC